MSSRRTPNPRQAIQAITSNFGWSDGRFPILSEPRC